MVTSTVKSRARCYLDKEGFHKLPVMLPSPLHAYGLDILLVSYSKGKVNSMPGFDIIKKLPSFIQLSPAISIGSEIKFTIDLITSPGCCELMHNDEAVLQKDLDFICQLEEINELFSCPSYCCHIWAGIITKGKKLHLKQWRLIGQEC